MAEEGIDLIGPLPERRKASWDPLKRRGVSPEFYPQAFSYDSGTDRYTCPAGKVLVFETQEKQGGWVRYRYRARVSDCRACPFPGAMLSGDAKRGVRWCAWSRRPNWRRFKRRWRRRKPKEIYKQRAGGGGISQCLD